jgi:predicted membrane protein
MTQVVVPIYNTFDYESNKEIDNIESDEINNELYQKNKISCSIIFNSNKYTLNCNFEILFCYILIFLVIYIKNKLYNYVVILLSILLYIYQLDKIFILLNLLFTVIFVCIAYTNLLR